MISPILPRGEAVPEGFRPDPLTLDQREQLREMLAMKLPYALIANRLGVGLNRIMWRLKPGDRYAAQGPNALAIRQARVTRIKANIEAYPGQALFPDMEVRKVGGSKE